MPEQQNNETTYLFVTIGSRTERGRRVTWITTMAEYQEMALARVGDIVTYDDREPVPGLPAYTLPRSAVTDGGSIHA
ncbi:hypothetical protein [Paraburkholderia sp. BL10I2N1]|uniref:hypothetical protein n=1 Tax=Paraburkholderia sp. BL10I2N1 TaxID=1938796 RepID=UPI00106128F0|nr:hypothetical protein [Paraburkholderia sp. BL10I2N1]TDN61604.1 hypothetical protein B0G77_5080 [Paraburkholderia sp. BL10I2N1]